MSLDGKAYDAVSDISTEELKKDNEGIKIILQKLDVIYKKDSQMDKLTKAMNYFEIKKKDGERMKEFIVRYENKYKECEDVGGSMNNEMKASHLLGAVKLDERDLHIVLGACRNQHYTFERVKEVLGNVFQNYGNIPTKEDTWLVGRKVKKNIICTDANRKGILRGTARKIQERIQGWLLKRENLFALIVVLKAIRLDIVVIRK